MAGGRAYSNAHFGIGSGPIFLDDVQCTSSSSQLLECPSRPVLSHNCLHSADAGVGCEGMCNLHFILWCTMQLVKSFTQLLAQLVSYDWQEVTFQMRAEWRSASTISGVLYVTIPGGTMMPLLCADNWTTYPMVSTSIIVLATLAILTMYYMKQVLWHLAEPILVLVLARSTSTMSTAGELRVISSTVHGALLSTVMEVTHGMLEWGAKVLSVCIIPKYAIYVYYICR